MDDLFERYFSLRRPGRFADVADASLAIPQEGAPGGASPNLETYVSVPLSWLSFLKNGLYNSDFNSGSTSDIAVSEVSGGDTVADYQASISEDLPYWVVSSSGGSIKLVADADSTGGQYLLMDGIGTNTIYQDAPIARTDVNWGVEVDRAYEFIGASEYFRIYLSYRDSTHALLGSRVKVYEMTNPGFDVWGTPFGYPPVGVTTVTSPGIAPAAAAYLRVEIESVFTDGSSQLAINNISVYQADMAALEVVEAGSLYADSLTINNGGYGGGGVSIASNDIDADGTIDAAGGFLVAGSPIYNYVPLSTGIAVFSGSTTTSDIAQSHTGDIGTIPTNAKAVAVRLDVKHSAAVAATLIVGAYNYSTWYDCEALSPPIAGAYAAANVHWVTLGGTNNREFDYRVIIGGAGTVTYWVTVIGYWTAY